MGMSPGCTGMPQGPPIYVKPAIRARGARLSGPLPLVTLWPRTSTVRNPAIPARALLPRETDIRDLGALATEVQKQHKSGIGLSMLLFGCSSLAVGEIADRPTRVRGQTFEGSPFAAEAHGMWPRERGGSSICHHKRRRNQLQCKDPECGGSSIYQHKRRRGHCKGCGGSSVCQHQRQRSRCKECGGSSICQHQRQRSRRKECMCGGSSICQHKRRRSQCKECGGGPSCQHKRRRSQCKECVSLLWELNLSAQTTAQPLQGVLV